MQTLEQALSELVTQGVITTEEAIYKSNRPNVLQSLLDQELTDI